MTMTMTMTMTMALFFFVFFPLFAGADAPYCNDVAIEAFLESLNLILEELDTTASNFQPPFLHPLIPASILLVFLTALLPRLAAAWGRVVRWASANSRRHWTLEVISGVVVWVDGVLRPFKLEGWRERALTAEQALDAVREEAADLTTALADAQARLAAAQGLLDRFSGIHQRLAAVVNDSRSGKEP
jgi:hypothetical protein